MKCPDCGALIRFSLSKKMIKEIYLAKKPIAHIAREFDVSRQTVYKIKTKKTHKKITDALDELGRG